MAEGRQDKSSNFHRCHNAAHKQHRIYSVQDSLGLFSALKLQKSPGEGAVSCCHHTPEPQSQARTPWSPSGKVAASQKAYRAAGSAQPSLSRSLSAPLQFQQRYGHGATALSEHLSARSLQAFQKCEKSRRSCGVTISPISTCKQGEEVTHARLHGEAEAVPAILESWQASPDLVTTKRSLAGGSCPGEAS